ncbi:MAG: HNH endonuclease [Minwuia sp.]|uniref:HNH endonuclease n=1 Tax=Minwuia sp. TaxID=2493630 RepID=UPI003A897053
MNRYLIKINGERFCPDNICRPAKASDWEGGEVLLEANPPVLLDSGRREDAPEITKGDELWIWTHEAPNHGNGWGLTARAIAGPRRTVGDDVALTLNAVERLERPFGYKKLGNRPTGCGLIDYVRTFRHRHVYLIEDDDYEKLVALAQQHGSALPDELRFRNETEWQSEIRENKDEVLDGFVQRRLGWQKARPGQQEFRDRLLRLYKGRCVLTGCSVPQALEAAHVLPHDGSEIRDRVENGLLLRRDLHAMFDSLLWSINPKTGKVRLSKHLTDRSYDQFDGKTVQHHVAPEPLRFHFTQFKKAEKEGAGNV